MKILKFYNLKKKVFEEKKGGEGYKYAKFKQSLEVITKFINQGGKKTGNFKNDSSKKLLILQMIAKISSKFHCMSIWLRDFFEI